MIQIDKLILLLFLLAAAISDFRFRRIPNKWVFYLLGIGVLWKSALSVFHQEQFFTGGISFLLLFLLSLLILYPLFFFSLTGGGDIKLMSVILAWCGINTAAYIFFLSSVLSLIYFFISRNDKNPFAVFLFLASVPFLI